MSLAEAKAEIERRLHDALNRECVSHEPALYWLAAGLKEALFVLEQVNEN